MNFNNSTLIIPILVIIIFYLFYKRTTEQKYFQWIEDHWFKKRNLKSKLSSLFGFVAISLLIFSLADLRGPEKQVTGKISEQKTIILIDTSASMLAEDVRPNRFKKAILLARHYIKKAIGQQMSIIVFSDSEKRIIPFTNDIDLLDARLSSIEDLNLARSGTGLNAAIGQSLQYFLDNAGEKKGNIIIFTDAEETQDIYKIEVPESVNVAVVGIGTAKGAVIPIRDKNGNFRENKKHNGENVITKLDENFLKKLSTNIKNYKYWIASSYSLPTEEIINFFSRSLDLQNGKNDFRIRPVLSNYLLIPAALLMILSLLLKQGKIFLTILVLFSFETGYAEEKPAPKEKSEKIKELERALKRNKLPLEGRLKLAQELLSEGFSKESNVLYEENLKGQTINENNIGSFSNWANAQVLSGNKKLGLETYRKVLKKIPDTKENELLRKAIKDNLLKALEEEEQKNKNDNKKGDSKDNEDKQDNKDKNDEKNNKDKNNDNKDQKNDTEGNSQNNNDNKNNESEEKDDQKKEEQKNKNDQNQDSNKDNDENKTDKEQKEKDKKEGASGGGEPKNTRPQKVPAILKQLMSDDNQLQKKLIDAQTTERKTRDKKDW